MENTRLSNGKIALITIGCLIAKVIIWFITGFSLLLTIALFVPSDPAKVTSIETRNDTIDLTVGTAVNRYIVVTATEEFSEEDLEFISDDESIATVTFKGISMTSYVDFTVTGHKEGTTTIYFRNADGTVVSDKITVTVKSNGAPATDTQPNTSTSTKPANTSTQKPATSDTTDTPESSSTSTPTQKPASTSTQKPANTPSSTQKPGTSTSSTTSDTGTASDTIHSTDTSSDTKTTINQDNWNGTTVYKTPTGKRYHIDPDCGGKNSTPTTLEEALRLKLTPCGNCVE